METFNIKDLEDLLYKADKIQDKVRREFTYEEEMRNYHGLDEIISFQEALEITKNDYTGFAVKSGIPGIDKALSEIRENDLLLITGDPGAGKTTLAMSMTANMSDAKIQPLWFTMEVGMYDFLRKFGERLPQGFMPKSITNRSITWIERKIVESIAKNGTKVVFIDNFNSLDDYYDSKGEQLSVHIGNLAMRIKKIALKYGIVVVLLVHSGKAEAGQTVSWKNIRDSQLIANACDSILVIWRKEKKGRLVDGLEYEPYSVVSVQKNRRFGTLGKANLIIKDGLFHETTTFYEASAYDDGQSARRYKTRSPYPVES
jgi:KaiC/GvpD/RAD55 family RecA-like ATPase